MGEGRNVARPCKLGRWGLAAAMGGCVVGHVSVRWALLKRAGPAAAKRVNFGPQHDKKGLQMGLQNSQKMGLLAQIK